MLGKKSWVIIAMAALLTLFDPTLGLAQHRSGGGRSFSGGARNFSGGGARNFSGGRSFGGSRGFAFRGREGGRDYDRGRHWGGRIPDYWPGGGYYSYGYYGAPYAYGPGYYGYYDPGYCNPVGYYDRWGYYHYYPGCY